MKYVEHTYGAIAHRDLEAARLTVENLPFVSVFNSQQACEKILKHYLQLKLPKSDLQSDLLHSHKLRRLAHAAQISELDSYREILLLLQDYYFDGRYPGSDYVEPDAKIAQELYEGAQKVVEIVDGAIEKLSSSQTSYFTFE